jgi:hypothetical protein
MILRGSSNDINNNHNSIEEQNKDLREELIEAEASDQINNNGE